MPRRPAAAKSFDPDQDFDETDQYQLEEDNFLEDLRSAVARVRSSCEDGLDLREGARTCGFDALLADFND